jgi:hypothetical protein
LKVVLNRSLPPVARVFVNTDEGTVTTVLFFYTPSGELVSLPNTAQLFLGTNTDLQFSTSAVTKFYSSGDLYLARYSKINGSHKFIGYYRQGDTATINARFSALPAGLQMVMVSTLFHLRCTALLSGGALITEWTTLAELLVAAK